MFQHNYDKKQNEQPLLPQHNSGNGFYLKDNRDIHSPVQLTKKDINDRTIIQLAVGKNKKKGKSKPKRKLLTSDQQKYKSILKDIREGINNRRATIQKIKQQVEDDDDVEWLDEKENELLEIGREAAEKYNEIIVEHSKINEVSNKSASGFDRPLRSQTKDRDKLVGELEIFAGDVNKIGLEVKNQFPTNAGGFGAKGRAHKMDDVEIDPRAKPFGKVLDNTFLSDITLDGNTFRGKVYKATPKVASEKSGPFTIEGKDASTLLGKNKLKILSSVEKGMSPIESPQTVDFKDVPVARGRGTGQYANMNNTNAAGYAWLLDVPGGKGQRWEWLHIRGAGLGGATDSTNLVAGVRDANTQMIPFESNIRLLGKAVKEKPLKYSGLWVRWVVNNAVARHAFKTISIAWKLIEKSVPKKGKAAKPSVPVKTSGTVHFSPLQTGTNISKNEVEVLEGTLAKIREGL